METALSKIAFIPFGYLMDKYRWNIFRGKIDETNYNQKWWEMKLVTLIVLFILKKKYIIFLIYL